MFHRVFPKLAITKQIYFILTNGKNRVISKAEVLGRLSFCGYELIDDTIMKIESILFAKEKNYLK